MDWKRESQSKGCWAAYHTGFSDGSSRSRCNPVLVTGAMSILSASVHLDSRQRISANLSSANSVNFRSKPECAVVIFFLAASSRHEYGFATNSFNLFEARPLSNSLLANSNGTGIVAIMFAQVCVAAPPPLIERVSAAASVTSIALFEERDGEEVYPRPLIPLMAETICDR
jgi:hypothetical protein